VTLNQAAQQLGVSATVIKRLITQGTLPARQVVSQAPWIIQRTDLDRVAVQAAVQMVRTGHRPLSRLSDRREAPGQAALEAGDTHAFSAPAEMHRALLVAGAQ
jgi:excisionase family DNA binding protein